MTAPLESSITPHPAFGSEENFYGHLEAYPWSTDAEFQSGLRAILGRTPPSDAQEGAGQDDLILQAKCFYYSRKTGRPIDCHAYKSWLRSRAGIGAPEGNGGKPSELMPSIDATIEGSVPRTASPLDLSSQIQSSNTSAFYPLQPDATTTTQDIASPSGTVPVTKQEPSAATDGPPAASSGPYPTSFAEIVELIQSGKPIPGIEEIPDTVLTGQGQPSTAAKRTKPWEMSDVRDGGWSGVDLYGGKVWKG